MLGLGGGSAAGVASLKELGRAAISAALDVSPAGLRGSPTLWPGDPSDNGEPACFLPDAAWPGSLLPVRPPNCGSGRADGCTGCGGSLRLSLSGAAACGPLPSQCLESPLGLHSPSDLPCLLGPAAFPDVRPSAALFSSVLPALRGRAADWGLPAAPDRATLPGECTEAASACGLAGVSSYSMLFTLFGADCSS